MKNAFGNLRLFFESSVDKKDAKRRHFVRRPSRIILELSDASDPHSVPALLVTILAADRPIVVTAIGEFERPKSTTGDAIGERVNSDVNALRVRSLSETAQLLSSWSSECLVIVINDIENAHKTIAEVQSALGATLQFARGGWDKPFVDNMGDGVVAFWSETRQSLEVFGEQAVLVAGLAEFFDRAKKGTDTLPTV